MLEKETVRRRKSIGRAKVLEKNSKGGAKMLEINKKEKEMYKVG